jgi:dihydrofolate reductase
MRSMTYSMAVSLDGYIVGPDGSSDWTTPDEEVFRLATDEVREVGVHLMGRRLYETMLYWETADQNPTLDYSTLEFAAIWKALPKVVLSTSLSAVQGNARLASVAWRRKSSDCEPNRLRATSRSAVRLSPPRRPRWV